MSKKDQTIETLEEIQRNQKFILTLNGLDIAHLKMGLVQVVRNIPESIEDADFLETVKKIHDAISFDVNQN